MMYYTPLFVEIPLYVTFPQPAQKRGKNEIMNGVLLACHAEEMAPIHPPYISFYGRRQTVWGEYV